MKKGDKLKCKKTINNVFGQPLFLKDEVYEVLNIETENNKKQYVTLNHISYGNEYMECHMEFIKKNFKLL